MVSIRNETPQRSQSRVKNWKSVGRVAALLLLLAAMTRPWLIDIHPAAEEACQAPLVWLGNGQCACLASFVASWVPITEDQSLLWVMWLLPTLPILSTPLLILGRERHSLWIFHLGAWGLTAVFALFCFLIVIWSSHFLLMLWGAGFSSLLAVAVLAGEIWTVKRLPDRLSRHNAY